MQSDEEARATAREGAREGATRSATEAFLARLGEALAGRHFLGLTLAKPRSPALGTDGVRRRRASGRLVEIRGEAHLSLLVEAEGKSDQTSNHALSPNAPGLESPALATVRALLDASFENGHLFTTTADYELRTNRRGEARLLTHKPTRRGPGSDGGREGTTQVAAPVAHNREKRYVLDPAEAPWLAALGVVGSDGKVKGDKADKYRQLQNILKILDEHVGAEGLPRPQGRPLRVVDMGCGKAYLTFALYDYLRRRLAAEPSDEGKPESHPGSTEARRLLEVTGIDRNTELMALCSGVAERQGLEGLSFACGDVDSYRPPAGGIDLLVALHACDTATDVAIHQGISGGARVIMVVPCCQKELRPQFKSPPEEQPLLKHDTYKDRYAQMLTDGIRGLLMESAGYRTRVMEFISDAHTHRNVMILGVYGEDYRMRAQKLGEAEALMTRYGIRHQALHALLSAR